MHPSVSIILPAYNRVTPFVAYLWMARMLEKALTVLARMQERVSQVESGLGRTLSRMHLDDRFSFFIWP